jgi:excisionase family DNA binding protein
MLKNRNRVERAGWRPTEWAFAVGIGRPMVFKLIREGRIDSVMFGSKMRIITTAPEAFLASLKNEAA